ncbi:MAG: type VI secretion system membrane subunit TssM [Myxococcota bacterium]
MWLYILCGIFLALVWTAWWFLQPQEGTLEVEILPTWVAVLITVVVVGALLGLYLFRRIRAARAARALEKAIAQQAQEQVLEAPPDQRPEVQALQKQMLDGMKALKRSRLGDGDRNPMYSMPWYAIVGPPGSGKTTALRHSGLSFPYLDPSGAGVRGVGGTRNCDWWFTNDAILLDTAGRYTTDVDDRDEWLAFLGMLRTHRKHKPLNGVLIAVAVDELIDATEDEVEATATRIRERIDEMQLELRMILPVYVLFTKCDLVSGFVEYFGDLKRSERGQAWGATLPLDADKSDPSQVFDTEFDLLVAQLHKRTVRRMGSERATRATKERVYHFPLEFAAIKRNLSDFIGGVFEPVDESPAAPKGARRAKTPLFRGFYFTSGTQEGKPLDRVVGAMGRAFGLRPAVEAEDETTTSGTESKSYFLRDVFTTVVFPDRDVAGRTDEELRRVRWQRVLVAAAALFVAMLLLVPAVMSYSKNRDLVEQTQQITGDAVVEGPLLAKIEKLDRLRDHVAQLDKWDEEGAPLSMRWASMYQGDELLPPALEQYVAAIRESIILPSQQRLESELRDPRPGQYLDDYNNLKAYLLLNDDVHLQTYDQWQVGRLTQVWADASRGEAEGVSERELRNKVLSHVSFYVDLQRRLRIGTLVEGMQNGEELDDPLIQSARSRLQQRTPTQRYYEQFVTALEGEKIDPAGDNRRENLKYPPITLNELFEDRPEALQVLSSRERNREGKYRQVKGQFTAAGRAAVLKSLENGYQLLEREQWVVPFAEDEKTAKAQITKSLAEVRDDYDLEYIFQWKEFFRDIKTKVPANNREAIQEFRILATPDWPYYRLLQALKDNTQFEKPKADQAAEDAANSGVAEQIKRRVERRIDRATRTPGGSKALKELGIGPGGDRVDVVPRVFESMVAFGFPAAAKEGETPPPSGLSDYVGQLEQLASEMTIIEEGPFGSDPSKATDLFEQAVADTEKKVLSMDDVGQELMRSMLLNPLRQSYEAMLKSAGGTASGLWEVEVWPPYRDTIKNRYPFNRASKRDASFDDAMAFFRPKDGVLWGFYENYLKSYHRRVGTKFVPASHLQGSPRPARAFTPFNPNLYNCLERAYEISDALFSQGAEAGAPGLRFRVNLTTVSPIVSEIEFEIDGQKRLYRNEKESWRSFTWPGPDQPLAGAAIRIRGAGGLNEEIRRDGPWGLWRLIESGVHGARKDDDRTFSVEWEFAGPPVTVRMEMMPTRQNHPFPREFFRNTNCPNSIGDSFGGG